MLTRLGKFALITFLFSILFSLTISAHAYVWYVDGNQGISGDGTSWFEAFKTIQEAVPWAVGSDEIWVKKGVYPLTSTINLNMKMISIYGGFIGWEAGPSERDLKNNTTTIDGQNLHRVFYVYYGNPRIDGFTIIRGKSGPSYNPDQFMGGAIYFDRCRDLVPVVINCVFTGNVAERVGGAIANYESSPYILNSSFSGNLAWGNGGAIYNTGAFSIPIITNCTFTNNRASGQVGGWDAGYGDDIYSSSGALPSINNSIIWGNPWGNSIVGPINVTYSNVNQDGFAGINGNIRQDPLLAGSGKFRLRPGSPCIDTGNNTAFPYPWYPVITDYFGNDRVIDGDANNTATIDMGAHEFVPGEVVGAWYVDGAAPPSGNGESWNQAFKTIGEAVTAAADGDDIYVRAGTYGPVSVNKALNFYGGYEGVTTVDAQNLDGWYGFNISNTSVNIYGFTITRTKASGIHSNNSLLTVTNTIFTANPGDQGGGIAIFHGGGATINNSTFTGNSASFYGGAIYAYGSITGPINVNNSTFTNNHAAHEGGAIYSSAASAPLIFTNCTFSNNSSDYLGGAIYSQSTLTLTNSTFTGNSGTQGGGAIYNTGSSAITGSTFSGNSAGAYSSGGAILNQGGTHTVSNSRFLGNTAGEDGGGIASGNLTVLTSIFAANRAINSDPYRGMGGGIRGGGAVQVINSTFYGNSANYAGGGMYLGELAGFCSQFRVYNSILWGNTASQYKETGTAPGTGIWGCPDVYQYSNVDQNDYINYAHNIRQNPMFVNISGTDPAAWDFHLQAGSPSIDRGSNTVPGLPAFDIDGEPRIMDGTGDWGAIADMGVDEVTGPQDPNPPTGTIVINGGSTGTITPDVFLNINVTDPSGMSQMCLSNTASCTTWEIFTGTKSWTLTAGEGAKTVYGWFRDSLGNTTAAPITGTIFVDTTPPLAGTLTATPGPYQVQLTWSGFSDSGSGIASYRLLGDWYSPPTSCDSGSSYQLYTGPNTSYLHTSTSQTYYYLVCAQDGAGNFSTGASATATPEVDTTPPTGSVVINGNATYTTTYYVTLTISASDPSGVTHMCVYDSPSSCPSHLWEPYATSKENVYLNGLGEQTVYVWFRDRYNNSNPTPFSDSIIADWQAPTEGTLTAVPGNGTISLSWSGFSDVGSGLAGYKLVHDPSGNPYCATSPILYQGSGTSYVHTGLTNGVYYGYLVCATDIAGNESWGVYASAFTPISVPTGLHITGYVNRGINLSWNPNPNEVVGGYRIDYRPSWAGWWNTFYAGNVTTHTLTGLYWGETYVFRVRAYDGNYNVTDFSNEVSGFVKQVSIDFDGDGKTDISVWRPGDGVWYIRRSSDQVVTTQAWGLGSLDDYPVPGDYDGDGKTDIAVWRPGDGIWYIYRSSDQVVTTQAWGAGSLNDVPVPGDYDGDGKTDYAVWRPGDGVWYTYRSSDQVVTTQAWGAGSLNDVPVPGDYDGDGKTDYAVWRPGDGVWYILRSSDQVVTTQAWGLGSLGDIPMPGDYDGDGKTDIAVWRPGDGVWYIWRSSDQEVVTQAWGAGSESDHPVCYYSAVW
jgi:predicted outer membrane repeat protein